MEQRGPPPVVSLPRHRRALREAPPQPPSPTAAAAAASRLRHGREPPVPLPHRAPLSLRSPSRAPQPRSHLGVT